MISEDKDTRQAIIAAKSLVSGTVNFLVIGIPREWRVSVNEIPPEILRYKVIDQYAWVTHGYVIHAIYRDEEEYLALEIDVYQREPKRPRYRLKSEVKGGSTYIFGHKARWTLGEFEKGVLRKTKVDALRISFFCDVTNRWIEIFFVGDRIYDVHKDVLYSITQTICHY